MGCTIRLTPTAPSDPQGSTLGTTDPDGTTALVAAILAGAQSLPGAGCRRQVGLFNDRLDGETAVQRGQRFEAAAAVCSRCPAQPACRSPDGLAVERSRCARRPRALL
ncbi:MAG: hypothetical protein M3308_04960 [Actinomycetota bacterium]|nr:hypothetical protein [Actinomycetota bacterium]